MEEYVSAETIAIISAVYIAANEIIRILKIESNSNIHLVLNIIGRIFGLKKEK